MTNEQGNSEDLWTSTKPYSQKVKFEFDKPVMITFPSDFERPEVMPSTDGKSQFCVFDVKSGENQDDSVLMTSSVTMLRNLKSHEPLSGKSLMVTKKSVGGKTFYYVEDAEQFNNRMKATPEPDEVDTDDAGLNGINL